MSQTEGWGRGAWGEDGFGTPLTDFQVQIVATNSPVEAGGRVDVDIEITNQGGPGEQTVTLDVEEQ